MHFETGPDAGHHRLRVQFTGSGSEYFRIWIVNLLLTIVTLSLYLPFAKARRLAYFHANTRVGDDALAFHGDPWKMLRGYLLMLLFGLAYVGAGLVGPLAAGVAAIAFAALWPALWRSSLRFRLANTSWRGLRMRFSGGLGAAYAVFWPVALPLFAAAAVVGLQVPEPGEPPPGPGELVLPLTLLALTLLMAPWWLARARRYQQDHVHWASERLRLGAGTGAFYRVALQLLLLVVLAMVVVVALTAAAVLGAGPLLGQVIGVAAYVLLLLVLMPLAAARLQTLVWNSTHSAHLRFRCRLPARRLIALTLKNLLLTVLTLGLYRPFAAVATARLRLEAVAIDLEGDPAEWQARMAERVDDAAGDFAGDFFGIDLGL